jgi:hypothetical protein
LALSLFLAAMAALVMLDRFSPATRGVAADLSESVGGDSCPAEFSRTACDFEWFEQQNERHQAAAVVPATPTSSAPQAAAVVELAREAVRVTAVYRLLMDNFRMTWAAIEDDGGMMEGFNYGSAIAARSAAGAEAAADEAIGDLDVLAQTEWSGDACPNFALDEADIRPKEVAGDEMQAEEPSVVDSSDLLACVRRGETDTAAEMNGPNQGLESIVRGSPSDAAAAYESLVIEPWGGPGGWLGQLAELWLRPPRASAAPQGSRLQPGSPLETELADALAEPRPGGGCPFLVENEKREGAATELAGPTAKQQGAGTSSIESWGGELPQAERSDFGWYLKEKPAEPAASNRNAAGAAGREELDPRTMAEAGNVLARSLADAGRLLEALSARMAELAEQAVREAARRQEQSARLRESRRLRPDVETAEIIYLEI